MRLHRNRHSEEFKEQIVRECQQVGNIAVVARRHEISAKTVPSWVRAARVRGSASPIPKEKDARLKEVERHLRTRAQRTTSSRGLWRRRNSSLRS